MKHHITLFFVAVLFFCYSSNATNYYINTESGRDSNKGTSSKQAFQSIAPVNLINLKPEGGSVMLPLSFFTLDKNSN